MSPLERNEEKRIIEDARSGDFSAFRKLVEGYQRQIYFLSLDFTGNHEDAEDVVQEVFLKAFRSLPNFRGEAKLSSWLHRIAVNTCLDFRRKPGLCETTRVEIDSEERPFQVTEEGAAGHPERQLLARDVRSRIEWAVRRLPPSEQRVFVLRRYHQFSTREVAEILERSEGTVKNLLFRSIQKLRRELANLGQEIGLGQAK